MEGKRKKSLAQIKEETMDLLYKRMGCPRQMVEQHLDTPLTGTPFFFLDIDMVYLLFETEKYFGIQIPEEKLLEYGFSTVNHIVELVGNYLLEP